MRGWLYVITNRAMPELVKVGFSTKDPQLRAQELGNTGAPHPYVVVYDVLVHDPREAERLVHQKLNQYSEGKEWFRCSLEFVRDVIRDSLGDRLIFDAHPQVKLTPEAQSNQARKPSSSSGPQTGKPYEGSTSVKSAEHERMRDSTMQHPQSGGAKPRGISHTALFQTVCGNCQQPYSVTLTRYDTVARCPRCKSTEDIAEYLKLRLML